MNLENSDHDSFIDFSIKNPDLFLKNQALNVTYHRPSTTTASSRPNSSRDNEKTASGSSFTESLLDLHANISNIDKRRVFKYPVTDHEAPDYAKIINNPMDLNTIRIKIKSNAYKNFSQFRADLILMCQNCLIYNDFASEYSSYALNMLQSGLEIYYSKKLQFKDEHEQKGKGDREKKKCARYRPYDLSATPRRRLTADRDHRELAPAYLPLDRLQIWVNTFETLDDAKYVNIDTVLACFCKDFGLEMPSSLSEEHKFSIKTTYTAKTVGYDVECESTPKDSLGQALNESGLRWLQQMLRRARVPEACVLKIEKKFAELSGSTRGDAKVEMENCPRCFAPCPLHAFKEHARLCQ